MSDEALLQRALEAELELCRAPLRDFEAVTEDGEGFARSDRVSIRVGVDPLVLPIPGMVMLAMRMLVGAHDLGRAEKLAWEYAFRFRDRSCSISLQKFGMYIYVGDQPSTAEDQDPSQAAEVMAREIQGKLSAATRCLERRVVSVLAEEQAREGRVTVRNQAGRLRNMYEYFRQLAHDAYAGQGALAHKHDEETAGSTVVKHFRFMAEETEGLYATVAMTVAYFSLLEHLLVVVLPATDFDPATESLSEFILSRLQPKFSRVFPAGDAGATRTWERLHVAAERWRNPYGHGGFDKLNGTIGFHVPGVGALPMLLSEIRKHPTFRFAPTRDTSYDELCALFDEVDTWLRESRVWAGMRWVEAGLDVPFHPEFLYDFRSAAAAGEGEFMAFLEGHSEAVDRAMNMDW